MRRVHIRPPGDGVVDDDGLDDGAAGGADREGHAGGALAAQEQLELAAAQAGEQLVDGQRAQVVEAVAEQLDGALVAPGEPLAAPPTVSATRMARLSLTVAL